MTFILTYFSSQKLTMVANNSDSQQKFPPHKPFRWEKNHRCRFCSYYQHTRRRGGDCQLLGGAVKGDWVACLAYIPPFSEQSP